MEKKKWMSNKNPRHVCVLILIISVMLVLLTGCSKIGTNTGTSAKDPNRTREYCSYYGEAPVYGAEHQRLYDCIRDGDGWYWPGFGHHHHK